MKRFLIVAVTLVGAAGCATSGSGMGSNSDFVGAGSVTGIVKLGDGINAAANACDLLEVTATMDGVAVGRATGRQSRNRCSFEIGNLPPNVDLGLAVNPGSGLSCANGAAKVSPENASVTLKNYQTQTVDFSATCG